MNKPFLLRPSGKDYLWGGQRLNSYFDKNIGINTLAETWECSTHPDGPSFVASGNFAGESLSDVIKNHPDFLGLRHRGQTSLPILVKFIDAKEDLSVQVHPSDKYAKENETGQLGKTEMWYVLDAGANSKLIYGFHHDMDERSVRLAIKSGTLANHLQQIPAKKDDIFFIPSGTVHAIGAGCLIAEVQENSNLTYRLFDYNRVDKDGKKRDLHIDKAMNVLNFLSSSEPRQPLRVLKYGQGFASELLSRCKYFQVYRMIINTKTNESVLYKSDSLAFRVLLCIDGNGTINFKNEFLSFNKGDCFFVPADSYEIYISGQAQFLDIRG